MAQDNLTKQTKKHLLFLAKQSGLSRASRLSKAELIARLQAIPASTTSPVGTAQADLSTQTHQSLLELARQRGLTGVGRLHKVELIARLTAATVTQPSPAPVSSHIVSGPERPAAVTTQPVTAPPQDTTASKFFPRSAETPAIPAPTLPSGYNDNRLVLLARDPHWLYAYWDFSAERISAALTQLGTQDARPILRIFDVTYINFDGTNAWTRVDSELTPFATSWYIPVPRSDASYCAEVGYRTSDGRFALLGRSNVAITPRDGVSPSATLHWFTPPERHPSPLPPAQSTPVPLTATRTAASDRGEARPPLSAPSAAEHPSSWSFGRGANPVQVRSGTITG